jgi:O-Antigen ligase
MSQPVKPLPLFDPPVAWVVILTYCLFSALLVILGIGKIANIVLPAGAVGVGLFLYWRYPLLYVGFTWWLWFLAPVVRRLVDYRSGFSDPSPILLAPYLVTLLSIPTVLNFLPRSRQIQGEAFMVSLAAVVYAFIVALNNAPFAKAAIGILDWITPILFGFYILAQWRDYPQYQRQTERIFFWFVVLAGGYGLYQYLVAPPWDTFWLSNAAISSAGKPLPREIRVWSLLNGPGVFAAVMMAGLTVTINARAAMALPGSLLGFLAFLLSQVRSAWVGLAFSIVACFSMLTPKRQIRLIVVVGLIMGIGLFYLGSSESFADTINSRLQSLSDLSSDNSATVRQASYKYFWESGLTNFVGNGIATGTIYDSAVIDSLSSLGWFGTIGYWSGMVMVYGRIFGQKHRICDPFYTAARSVCLGFAIQLVAGSVMLGLPGVVMWGFLGLATAAQNFHAQAAVMARSESIAVAQFNPNLN